jgi:hypothetical protein
MPCGCCIFCCPPLLHGRLCKRWRCLPSLNQTRVASYDAYPSHQPIGMPYTLNGEAQGPKKDETGTTQ